MNNGIEKLLFILEKSGKNYDLYKIRQAYHMAAELHEGQFRNSGEAYISHPIAVAEIAAGLGLDTDSICAALLHDTVEDTDITLDDLFNLESNGATVKYALEEVSTDGNITAAIDGDAISVNAAAGAKKVVVVSATQKGKTQYVRLTINVDASTYVGDVINPNAKVSVNGNTIKVSGAKSVNVFSTTGALISAGADTIDVVPGVYLVVADGITHKVLVK